MSILSGGRARLPEEGLPAPKRLPVSPEWSGEQQVVGRKWRQHLPPEQS
jgi:NADH-quinone oxidoreductase subunit I